MFTTVTGTGFQVVPVGSWTGSARRTYSSHSVLPEQVVLSVPHERSVPMQSLAMSNTNSLLGFVVKIDVAVERQCSSVR